MLMGRPVLAQAESLPQLATLIKDHFDALANVNAKRSGGDAVGPEELPVAVRQHLDLVTLSPHIQAESSVEGSQLCICAKEDGRIHCLSENEGQQPNESIGSKAVTRLTILHFNDVYEIQSRKQEPVGGVARFIQRLKAVPEGLVLFSGDALAPSIMSTVTKGAHMIKFLNMMNIKAACMGNHDFDFGVDHLEKMVADSNFPWMLSNVTDAKTGARMANGLESLIITHEGVKIGLMGLIEEEWLATLATISREDVTYVDYVEVGRRLNGELRAQPARRLLGAPALVFPLAGRLSPVPKFDMRLTQVWRVTTMCARARQPAGSRLALTRNLTGSSRVKSSPETAPLYLRPLPRT